MSNDKKVHPPVIPLLNNVIPLNNASIGDLSIKKASEIVDRAQTWLWDKFIPKETCTLIAGVPGIGKSQFLMWLAATVSRGGDFSIASLPQIIEQGDVLILACEDSEATGIIPRLKALNADLERIHLLRAVEYKDEPSKRRLVALDEDLLAIEKFILQTPTLKLIIIDPISGFSGKTKDHIDCEVRNFLNRLNDLAERHKIAIVLNKHLRKPKGEGLNSAINEVAGSGAWVAVVRQSFVISPHPEDESIVLFANLKVNIHKKKKESFGYSIQSHTYTTAEGEVIETSHLEWCGQSYEINADEAIDKKQHEVKSKGKQVRAYLLERLKDGGASGKKLLADCVFQFDVSDRTVYRIKNELNIGDSASTNYGDSWWYLSPDSPPK